MKSFWEDKAAEVILSICTTIPTARAQPNKASAHQTQLQYHQQLSAAQTLEYVRFT